jgi:ATP:corrinoid adenosyltransferase
MRKAFSDLCE